jgi:hypothetical protein
MGTDIQSFSDAARAAVRKGLPDFRKFAGEALQAAADAIVDFNSSMTESLDFTGEAIERLGEKAHAGVGDYIEAFNRATRKTRAFGRDLLELAAHGGEGLATMLAGMGDAGVLAADRIASGTDEMRDRAIAAFNRSGTEASKWANRMTEEIVGTLKDIEAILSAIAKEAWDINLFLNDHVSDPLAALKERLDIPDQFVDIYLRRHYDGGGVPEEEQHGGPVWKGRPYIVGEAGPELFVPGVSGRIIPNDELKGGAEREGMSQILVRLDRRRFVQETDHDHMYRGW